MPPIAQLPRYKRSRFRDPLTGWGPPPAALRPAACLVLPRYKRSSRNSSRFRNPIIRDPLTAGGGRRLRLPCARWRAAHARLGSKCKAESDAKIYRKARRLAKADRPNGRPTATLPPGGPGPKLISAHGVWVLTSGLVRPRVRLCLGLSTECSFRTRRRTAQSPLVYNRRRSAQLELVKPSRP